MRVMSGGRFCGNTYQVGEEMFWWPLGTPKWGRWSEDGHPVDNGSGAVEECCYAQCVECSANLYAIIKFQAIRAISVSRLGLEALWPPNFEK